MDWDGIGVFAMFMASGAVGVGVVALRAYRARLSSKLELARINRPAAVQEDVQGQLQDLESRVHQLTERLDFTERLLETGQKDATDPGRPGAG